jgi:hypothetical protein
MIELPDDELDKLFRKSSEELDPTFDPNDWSELKKRLDAEDGIRPGGWFRKLWPLGLLLLFISGGLASYYWANDAEKMGSVEKTRVASKGAVAPTGTGKSAELKGVNDKSIVQEEETISKTNDGPVGASNDKKALTKSESGKILPRSRSKAGGVFLEPNLSLGKGGNGAFSSISKKEVKKSAGNNRSEHGTRNENSDSDRKDVVVLAETSDLQSVENGIETLPEQKNDLKKTAFPVEKARNGKRLAENREIGGSVSRQRPVDNLDGVNSGQAVAEGEKKEQEFLRTTIIANALYSRNTFSSRKLILPKIKITEPVIESKAIEPEKEQEPVPKFAVRFGYSPDLSTVGIKNFSKPGAAFSLLAEYNIFHRLYAQTGVVTSEKKYNAKAGEYEWPASWNNQKARPISTDATCKVIEIPLNLRYDLVNSARSRWFTGAGMSSYYMQKENYVYNYAPHTYGIIWKDHEAKTGWFLFSHINASAGYEYRISKKLSLLAEPYVRIPVKRVGYGKVNLTTTGIWISVRYTPVFK